MTTKSSSGGRRPHWSGVLFVLPASVLVLGVTYAGIAYNGWVSTLDWDGFSPNPERVGLDNYRAILVDDVFLSAVGHVAVFAVLSIAGQMVIGFAAAVVLTGPVYLANLYRVLIFIPVVLAPTAVAASFRQILGANGAFNDTLRAVGLGGLAQSWTADPRLALYALVAVSIWQYTGFSFVLYQAALTQINSDVLEAAQLDGAPFYRILWSIVLPQLKGTHFTLVLIGIIGALKAFDVIWLITGGGPGRSTEFPATYIYRSSILEYHLGYAAALSMILLLLALILTRAQISIFKVGERS